MDQVLIEYKLQLDTIWGELNQLKGQLRQTERTGVQAANQTNLAYNKNARTIEQLEANLKQLRTAQRDTFDPAVLKDFNREINQTQGRIKKLQTTGVGGLKSSLSGLTGTVGKLGAAFGVAFGVQQIISFGKEAITLAANAEGVVRAFDRLDNPGLLQNLRTATRGTVSDLELMQAAVRAEKFQIPLEQLGSLLQFAQVRARETGVSVDYLTDSIITGIGRKSTKILDNLAISTTQLKDEMNGAGIATASVGEIAEAVGSIARKSLESMGEQADTTADKISQLSADWTNFKVATGEALIAAGGFLVDFTKSIEPLRAQIRGFLADIGFKGLDDELIQKTNTYNEVLARASNASTFAKQSIDELNTTLAWNQKILGEAEKGSDKYNIAQARIATITKLIADKTNGAGKATKDYQATVADLRTDVQAYTDALEQTVPGTEKNRQAVTALQKAEDALKIALGQETDAQKAAAKARDEATKAADKAAEEKKKANEKLQQEINNAKADLIDDPVARLEAEHEARLNEIDQTVADEQLKNELIKLEREQFEKDITGIVTDEAAKRAQEAFDKEIAAAERVRDEKLLTATQDKTSAEEIEAQHLDNLRILYKKYGKDILGIDLQIQDGKNKTRENDESKQKAANEAIVSAAQQLGQQLIDLSIASSQVQISQLKAEKEAGIITEEEYQKKYAELRNKQLEKEKIAAIFSTLIQQGPAVARAFSDGGPFLGPILAALILATIATQISQMKAQEVPQFKEGEVDIKGKGTATSDSIDAKISRGESVINARSTANNKNALKFINRNPSINYEDYLWGKFLKQQQPEKSSTADNLLKSLKLHAQLDDHNLMRGLKNLAQVDRENTTKVVKAIKSVFDNQTGRRY